MRYDFFHDFDWYESFYQCPGLSQGWNVYRIDWCRGKSFIRSLIYFWVSFRHYWCSHRNGHCTVLIGLFCGVFFTQTKYWSNACKNGLERLVSGKRYSFLRLSGLYHAADQWFSPSSLQQCSFLYRRRFVYFHHDNCVQCASDAGNPDLVLDRWSQCHSFV